MYAWEKMFQQTALEKGKMKYKEHRVTELKTDGENVTVLWQKGGSSAHIWRHCST